jgi:hypothetical protein
VLPAGKRVLVTPIKQAELQGAISQITQLSGNPIQRLGEELKDIEAIALAAMDKRYDNAGVQAARAALISKHVDVDALAHSLDQLLQQAMATMLKTCASKTVGGAQARAHAPRADMRPLRCAMARHRALKRLSGKVAANRTLGGNATDTMDNILALPQYQEHTRVLNSVAKN